MKFEFVHSFNKILELYNKPISIDRFNDYLNLLQGDTKADLQFPIHGFNPMAKSHVIGKINELIDLGAEDICRKLAIEFSTQYHKFLPNEPFKIVINVSDDLMGGWTNRYTSDFENRFNFNGIFSRNFCTPVFWTSETYSTGMIEIRIKESILRTIYWTMKAKPKSLIQCVEQENFILKQVNSDSTQKLYSIDSKFESYKDSDEYHVLFNYFFGEEAAASLAYPII